MKFELKTDNEDYSNSFKNVIRILLIFGLVIFFTDVAIKLGVISRNYQIEYSCKLLSTEKTKSNFKKLSRLTDIKSKQRIWEFCREFVK